MVDGQENPLANFHASKLYEVQKHLALTSHMYQMTPLLISKRSWDRLSAGDKKLVTQAAKEATTYQRDLSKQVEDKLLDDIKAKGVQVTTIDAKAFAQATAKVQQKWQTGPIGPYVSKVVSAAQAQ
ncbi:2,3-diketo-L-gulonate-binding periplasmic protein YiaO precursor [compost metagenome]